jgi:hypothetical protein
LRLQLRVASVQLHVLLKPAVRQSEIFSCAQSLLAFLPSQLQIAVELI